MDDPTDQPAQQADPHCEDQVVRLDVGGWISGPCLNAEEMGMPVDGRTDLEPSPLAERHPGPGQ
jgi:hypothetical protein